ncbi:ExbD/TolR family protein [Chitinilyticum litopenaei]|uniref:ExbD/TolR family protein n=1 Tax=Chitinilyticum litopenaei TaxID=1121276 RepID=UPI00048CC41D|nr:biopolymer transporter ExbD [Chitinilyticum litopenaei]
MAFGSFSGQEQAPMAEINTTPLVDVMLVLLVVFIVTAPVMKHAVRVELPKAEAAKLEDKQDVIRLGVTADGTLKWGEEDVARADLPDRFAAAFAKDPLTEVHVYADKEARYEHIAQTMAAAQRAGLSRIGLMTDGSE